MFSGNKISCRSLASHLYYRQDQSVVYHFILFWCSSLSSVFPSSWWVGSVLRGGAGLGAGAGRWWARRKSLLSAMCLGACVLCMAMLNSCSLICSALPTCKSSPLVLFGVSHFGVTFRWWNETKQPRLITSILWRGGRGKGAKGGVSTQSYTERASEDPRGLRCRRGGLCLAQGVWGVRTQGSHPLLSSGLWRCWLARVCFSLLLAFSPSPSQQRSCLSAHQRQALDFHICYCQEEVKKVFFFKDILAADHL